MASASTQEKIDEPTRKFLRLPGNAVNALLVKLPAQGIPEQVNTRYCLSEVHQRSLRRLGPHAARTGFTRDSERGSGWLNKPRENAVAMTTSAGPGMVPRG